MVCTDGIVLNVVRTDARTATGSFSISRSSSTKSMVEEMQLISSVRKWSRSEREFE